MKTIVSSIFLLLVAFVVPVKSAVTVSELTAGEADLLKPTAVFKYTAQRGGSSGASSKESILSTTSELPDVSTDVTYSFPDTLSLQADNAGNLGAALGSGLTLSLPIVELYDSLLIQVYNYNTVNEGASFEGVTIGGVSIRNLFADLGPIPNTDQVLIHLNGQKEWTLSGDISFDPLYSTGSNNRVEVWGVTTIPEPATYLLCCAFLVTSLLLRSRNFSGN